MIDSWAWIEYFNGSEVGRSMEKYFGNEKVIVSSINIAEVFRHLLAKKGLSQAEDAASYMLGVSFMVPMGARIAVEAAKIKHQKKWGLGDSIVLATALEHKATVVTGDSDFKSEANVVYLGK
ncbi:type II toxin-antitoxin system VapC family toxin [Candidatus Woesearchaeota archaeon]|nr:type II toxin-antitoxin system VapC family toxin [Candidatus Woesearchaeota archaeon]